jgi:SagB-type dehydrogenase family enzyme
MKEQKILTLKLVRPRSKGETSIEEALKLRRTVRSFSNKEIDLPTISQLLWALQGVAYVETSPEGKKIFHRTAPSAGKTFPLEVYVIFEKGLFRYESRKHVLYLINDKDIREKLSEAAMTPLNKDAIKTAPLTIILTADNKRALAATPLFESAVRFVHLEAGHATQNLILQATSLGLGVCTMTSYNVAAVYEALKLPLDHRPIYLLPVGFPKEVSS